MRTLAIAAGLLVAAIGAAGIVAPDALVAIGLRSVTPVGLYVAAAVRVAIGLILLGASPGSRMPRTLGVFGIVALAAGLATPFLGVERARVILDWWFAGGAVVIRLWAVVAVLFGGFIIHAAGGSRRAA